MWYSYELTHGSSAQLAAREGCLRVSLAFCFEQTEHQTSALQRLHDDDLSVQVMSPFVGTHPNIRDQHGNLAFFRIDTCTGTRSPHRQSVVLTMDRGSGNDMTWSPT
jgi:hypothetical protein